MPPFDFERGKGEGGYVMVITKKKKQKTNTKKRSVYILERLRVSVCLCQMWCVVCCVCRVWLSPDQKSNSGGATATQAQLGWVLKKGLFSLCLVFFVCLV